MKADFNEGEMVTGMCLWEAWMELTKDRPAPTDQVYALAIQLHDGIGAYGMRSVMSDLVRDCDAAWDAASKLEQAPDSFDWDFCPNFLRGAVLNGRIEQLIAKQYT